jgi:DNA-directed RNA polymerase specialized sigma24 family protein
MSMETPPQDGPFVDLTSLDPEALREHLEVLIPLALQQLQEGFGLGRLRVRDESEAEAILWSACTSFLSHAREGDFSDATTPHELAAQLLRIAANRAQRRRRHDNRPQERPATSEPADSSPGPVQSALRSELIGLVREVIESLKEELRGQQDALRIVELFLEDMDRSQEDIALRVGLRQSTVSRRLTWFRDQIQRMLQNRGVA